MTAARESAAQQAFAQALEWNRNIGTEGRAVRSPAALPRVHSPEPAGGVPPGRREEIRRHIEAHLDDPQLTPGRVAAALHLSTRYLHQVFNRDGETVARYILRRRVEECARALHDGTQAACSVTEIAFRHGFNDASHFGRVFRASYGVTPREYRRRRAAPGLPVPA